VLANTTTPASMRKAAEDAIRKLTGG